MRLLPAIRPIAAADYFGSTPVRRWVATSLLGAIFIDRSAKSSGIKNRFQPIQAALERGEIIVLFPEGSRGVPEQYGALRRGVHVFMRRAQHVPMIPVMIRGLGKALPKGEALFVPHNCDVVIGKPLRFEMRSEVYLRNLEQV